MNTSTLSNKKSTLTVIFLTVFIYLVGFGVIIPLIPILSRDYGASALETGLLMSCYSAMQFLFSPFWGKLSDRWGRRPILIGCLFGEFCSYILLAFSSTLTSLFIARILAGFFGASISTASAYISDVTGEKERSKGMALIGVAFGLGFVIGPAIGGVFLHFGQGVLGTSLFVAGLCLLNFLFAWKFLKESLHKKNLEKRKARFAVLWNYLRLPTVGPLILAFFMTSLAMSSMEATLILYMGDKFQWSAKEVSFGFAFIGLIMIFTQGFLVRKLLPLWGERQVLKWGLIFFGIGFLGITLATQVSTMAITMTFLALGQGLLNPAFMGSISLLAPAEEQGTALGVNQSLSALGRIIGPILGGALYANWDLRSPFWLSAGMAFLALFLIFSLGRKIPNAAKRIL